MDVRKKFFYDVSGEALARFAQRGDGCPSFLETLVVRLDGALSTDGAVVSLLIAGSWTRRPSRVPSNSNNAMMMLLLVKKNKTST